ncbi:MAG: S8 family serine peptidase [Mycobacteriaceae bacterium]|uniref:S8 family serine peptidase n=1 Tax=Corynebacterium sp. TaxID=1720 RepID=UPI003F9B0C96
MSRAGRFGGAPVAACLLTLHLGFASPLSPSPAAAQERCDQPAFGGALPVDLGLPHDLSTGRGVGVALVDTGAASPGIIAERPDDRDHCLLHGTAVAGVLRTIAPDARIVSVRQGTEAGAAGAGQSTVADLVDALDRARGTADDHQVRVVNISVVACEDTAELRRAVSRAEESGLLVVAAAGNAGQCSDGQIPFPAALPGVLTVGGVDPRADGSAGSDLNAGRRSAEYSVPGGWVDLHAPGGPVSGLLDTGGDGAAGTIVGDPAPFTGTSFAAPVVSATAALVWQVRPDLSAQQVRSLLVTTAQRGVVPVVDPAAAVTAALDGSPDSGSPHSGRSDAVAFGFPDKVVVSRTDPEPRDLRIPLALAVTVALTALVAVIVRARRTSPHVRGHQ